MSDHSSLNNARSQFLLDCITEFFKIERKELAHSINVLECPDQLLLLIATLVLVVFWLRDYMSLRISPCRNAVPRSLAYGIAVVLTAMLIWKVVLRIGLPDLAQWLQSPRILILLIAAHIAASIPSIWIRQTQNYHWMWATALLPAPVVWFLLLQATLLFERSSGVEAVEFGFFAIALLWAASMVVIIFRTRYSPMPLEDLDFAVSFGSLSHGVALCVFPLALLFT